MEEKVYMDAYGCFYKAEEPKNPMTDALKPLAPENVKIVLSDKPIDEIELKRRLDLLQDKRWPEPNG